MLKKEMLEIIAKATFPKHYSKDCKAIRGYINSRMKYPKYFIEPILDLAYKVLEERRTNV